VLHQKMGQEPYCRRAEGTADLGIQHQGGPDGNRSRGIPGDPGRPGRKTTGAAAGTQSPEEEKKIDGLSAVPGLGTPTGTRQGQGADPLGHTLPTGHVPLGAHKGLPVFPIDPVLFPDLVHHHNKFFKNKNIYSHLFRIQSRCSCSNWFRCTSVIPSSLAWGGRVAHTEYDLAYQNYGSEKNTSLQVFFRFQFTFLEQFTLHL